MRECGRDILKISASFQQSDDCNGQISLIVVQRSFIQSLFQPARGGITQLQLLLMEVSTLKALYSGKLTKWVHVIKVFVQNNINCAMKKIFYFAWFRLDLSKNSLIWWSTDPELQCRIMLPGLKFRSPKPALALTRVIYLL